MTSTDRPISRSRLRNQQLRTALHAAFGQVPFTVRNGAKGVASIGWTDGPTEDQVREVCRAVLSDDGQRPWRFLTCRTVSDTLIAVSYLRADATGRRYWVQRHATDDRLIERGEQIPVYTTRCEVWHLHYDVDAATITEAERARAALALALAGDLPPDDQYGASGRCWAIAETVYHRRDVIDAVLAPAPA